MKTVSDPTIVSRVTYIEDVAAYPDYQYQKGDGRWDDPRIGTLRRVIDASLPNASEEERNAAFVSVVTSRHSRVFRSLYAGESRLTCYIECMTPFRSAVAAPGPLTKALLQGQRDVAKDADLPEYEIRFGTVPLAHVRRLYVGEIRVENSAQPLVDVEAPESVQEIRSRIIEFAKYLGYDDVTRGEILGSDIELTQQIAKNLYMDPDLYAGIFHTSTHGKGLDVYTFFESTEQHGRSQLTTLHSELVRLDDPEFQEALAILRVSVIE